MAFSSQNLAKEVCNIWDLLTQVYCDLLVYAVLGYYLPYMDPLYWINNFTDETGNTLHFGNVPFKYLCV